MPEFIVVGVINTDRSKDIFPEVVTYRDGTKDGGRADAFLDFVGEELVPQVEKTYRTEPLRVLYGTSNTGFTAVYALFGHGWPASLSPRAPRCPFLSFTPIGTPDPGLQGRGQAADPDHGRERPAHRPEPERRAEGAMRPPRPGRAVLPAGRPPRRRPRPRNSWSKVCASPSRAGRKPHRGPAQNDQKGEDHGPPTRP
ncbi:MAG: alpha/beta hydrolase-fold protein [Candidatus Moduliflexus flocculans]|nr:alpha/beta hydrolase-fold protein [Candidatus Moduliflexus flocculans]